MKVLLLVAALLAMLALAQAQHYNVRNSDVNPSGPKSNAGQFAKRPTASKPADFICESVVNGVAKYNCLYFELSYCHRDPSGRDSHLVGYKAGVCNSNPAPAKGTADVYGCWELKNKAGVVMGGCPEERPCCLPTKPGVIDAAITPKSKTGVCGKCPALRSAPAASSMPNPMVFPPNWPSNNQAPAVPAKATPAPAPTKPAPAPAPAPAAPAPAPAPRPKPDPECEGDRNWSHINGCEASNPCCNSIGSYHYCGHC